MKNWQVSMIILWAILSALVLFTIIVKHRHEKMRRLYNATQWRMPYLSMMGDSSRYVTTHIDNICQRCQGVKDTKKIEFDIPGRVRVLTCVCARSFGDEGWRWVSGGTHL